MMSRSVETRNTGLFPYLRENADTNGPMPGRKRVRTIFGKQKDIGKWVSRFPVETGVTLSPIDLRTAGGEEVVSRDHDHCSYWHAEGRRHGEVRGIEERSLQALRSMTGRLDGWTAG